jgi:type IV pilus assembly protein PilA
LTPEMGYGKAESLGLAAATANCDPIAPTSAADTSGSLKCTIVGGPATVKGTTITWTRDLNGQWTCEGTALQRFIGDKAACKGA